MNQWLRSELDGYPTLAENTGEHTIGFCMRKVGIDQFLLKKQSETLGDTCIVSYIYICYDFYLYVQYYWVYLGSC